MNPTNNELAEAIRDIANGQPLGAALILRLAADRLAEPVADADGWIEWDGGQSPNLPVNTRVDVIFRDGGTDTSGQSVEDWKDVSDDENNWLYSGDDDPAEIIAYRIHQ